MKQNKADLKSDVKLHFTLELQGLKGVEGPQLLDPWTCRPNRKCGLQFHVRDTCHRQDHKGTGRISMSSCLRHEIWNYGTPWWPLAAVTRELQGHEKKVCFFYGKMKIILMPCRQIMKNVHADWTKLCLSGFFPSSGVQGNVAARTS